MTLRHLLLHCDAREQVRRELQKAREEAAKGSERIVEMERSQQRLQRLYDISNLLTCFQGVERTVPEVVAVVAQALPLRSAIFVLETGGAPRTLTWQAEGETIELLRVAKAHAQTAYSHLVGKSVDLEREEARTFVLPRPPATAKEARTGEEKDFVILPFALDHGPIFGAFQVQSARELEELDLAFINAVVNQLALAINRHSADQALRASEAKFAGIISIAADAIVSIDEAQRIVMFNDGAEKIFGWSRDEVLGKPLGILLPERFRDVHRQHVRDFDAGPGTAGKMGERRRSIFMAIRKSGEEFPADVAISKLGVGGARLFTAILRDITEQKKIEHEEEFLVEVGAIFATTLDSQKTLTNIAQLAMREFADFCAIEFLDEQGELRRLALVTSDPAKAEVAEALKRFELDRSRPYLNSAIFQSKQPQMIPEVTPETIRAVAQSEEHRRLLEAIAPTSMMGVPLIVNDRLLGALLVASCRPGRRYGDGDLRFLEEVGGRAALALENARLHLATERAVQARDDLLGIVAHDLRNPLSTILSQAALLRRPAGEPDRRSQQSEVIERAATRMNRLIQDLLDVTRMEAGHLSIERARVLAGQVVLDSVEAHKPLASSRSLELRLDVAEGLPEIWADRDRLLQVFENLIGNAAKFTARGGQVTVGARPGEGEVLFWVADTGAGILPAELPHLFERFWQARKAGRRGLGLGLPIAKGIVEAHGGRVWVESTPGLGSTFYFTVPVAPPVQDRPR
jgi:PAS domain S-box-containing protein